MSENSWVWQYFFTDHAKHGNNQSAKRCWCAPCLNAKITILRNEDQAAEMNWGRSEADLHIAARAVVKTYAGKPLQHMLPHLRKCQFAQPNVRAQAEAAIAAAAVASAAKKAAQSGNKENAPPPNSLSQYPSTSLPSTPRRPLSACYSAPLIASPTLLDPTVTPPVKRANVGTQAWDAGVKSGPIPE
ncbi:hypothetical protein HGRIS_006858 [Hohenbuehelia grisea]|uniref:Uncharacterized protein n=1 Tax=Hohenbuehelia grisea TaxID=104357 RepID=A0ABR3JAV1_9AGAR